MPRGYRYSILTAFGWLILVGAGQPPENAQKPENAVAADNIEQAADSVASAIRQATKTPEKDGGCNQGEDKRESDLCAQWKAADAARDAAQYGFWTLLISAVGTALLIWTLWETRANARRELRAYVSVKVTEFRITYIHNGITAKFATLSHNGGATPAYDVVHFGFVSLMSHEQAASELATVKNIDKAGLTSGPAIHSGEDFPTEFPKPVVINQENITQIISGKLGIYVFGVTSYVDTFGYRRRTDFCYFVTGDDFAEAYKMGASAPPEGLPLKWRVAPFHNGST